MNEDEWNATEELQALKRLVEAHEHLAKAFERIAESMDRAATALYMIASVKTGERFP